MSVSFYLGCNVFLAAAHMDLSQTKIACHGNQHASDSDQPLAMVRFLTVPAKVRAVHARWRAHVPSFDEAEERLQDSV